MIILRWIWIDFVQKVPSFHLFGFLVSQYDSIFNWAASNKSDLEQSGLQLNWSILFLLQSEMVFLKFCQSDFNNIFALFCGTFQLQWCRKLQMWGGTSHLILNLKIYQMKLEIKLWIQINIQISIYNSVEWTQPLAWS